MEAGAEPGDRRAEQIGDVQGDVLGRGHRAGEMGHVLVEEGVVEGLHHQLIDQALQGGEVADHAGAGIDRTAHADLQHVVVAMTMGPGALAVNSVVLFGAQLGPRQAMGRREMGLDGEERFHGIAEHIGPELVGFVKAQPHQRQVGLKATPDRQGEGFGGGQDPAGLLQVEFRPGLVEEAEIELGGHLLADGVLHIREVEHHAVGIERATHRHDQLVVVAVAGSQAAGTKASLVVSGAELGQPIAVAGTETGAARDHTRATGAMGVEIRPSCCRNGGHRARRRRRHGGRSHICKELSRILGM